MSSRVSIAPAPRPATKPINAPMIVFKMSVIDEIAGPGEKSSSTTIRIPTPTTASTMIVATVTTNTSTTNSMTFAGGGGRGINDGRSRTTRRVATSGVDDEGPHCEAGHHGRPDQEHEGDVTLEGVGRQNAREHGDQAKDDGLDHGGFCLSARASCSSGSRGTVAGRTNSWLTAA